MELRDRIVKSALEVFSEFGYEKATIAQIVKKAESSKGGFYHHFQSKKEVLDEITTMYLDEVYSGYNRLIEDTKNDTIYLLNNVFNTINDYKKQKLSNWKELVNLYSHRDSYAIVQKMAFDFVNMTADIYEKLILKGIDERLVKPKCPKALASMWAHEVTRLYSKVSQIVSADGDDMLYNEFIAHAQFVEDTINHALNMDKDLISIRQPAVEYLDMAIDMMKKINEET